jgi:hypothetical protein
LNSKSYFFVGQHFGLAHSLLFETALDGTKRVLMVGMFDAQDERHKFEEEVAHLK